MVAYCVWLSIDPVRRKIDFYPKSIALRIEKSYLDRVDDVLCTCVLGADFFNSTIHFDPNGYHFQTTPGMSLGRAGFKQPGYRSVKRVILNGDNSQIEIFSKQNRGEWRIAQTEWDSQIKFNENVPLECKILISDQITELEVLETWKPQDIDSDELNKNVIVWQWCRGTFENQGNLLKLSSDWFIPYNHNINEIIENGYKNNINTIINLPSIGERLIVFDNESCYAYQKSPHGRAVRFIRRIVTNIKELKSMFDRISKPSINISDMIANLYENNAPHHFNCPILQDIMKDPVKTIDGHVYDREAIERWFTHNITSPLTGLRLQSTILTPLTELKKEIEEYLISLQPLEIT